MGSLADLCRCVRASENACRDQSTARDQHVGSAWAEERCTLSHSGAFRRASQPGVAAHPRHDASILLPYATTLTLGTANR